MHLLVLILVEFVNQLTMHAMNNTRVRKSVNVVMSLYVGYEIFC